MKFIRTILKLAVILLFTCQLFAGPTIIRDNRVTDLSTTPVLGRGYSIGTNTFQSTCMQNVIITEPSYDMKYSFTQIEDKGTERKSKETEDTKETSSSKRKSASISTTSGGIAFLPFIAGGGGGSTYNSTRSGVDQSLRSLSKKTVIEGKTWYSHSMLVTINLMSYYASVDESRSKLSKSAVTLLTNNDLPGFFSSCGPYYVRSIGRHATFISIFSYQSESTTRDENFEDNLRTEISRFSTSSQKKSGAGAVIGPGLSVGWSAAKSSKSASDKSREVEDQQRRESFNSNAESYRLTINTSAYGLGKDKKATLISFDMDSFKSAVKDAFMSMQNPRTGKVGSIEVVPWVENTEFQALVNLEQEEIPQEGALKDATGDTAKKPEVKLLYEKKLILNSNAEFFMEIERTDRNKLNMYYKAKLCKKNIDVNFKVDGSLKPEYGNALLVNHRGGDLIQLTLLDEKLTEEFVEEYYRKEQKFMFGVKRNKDKPGAAECIRQIMLNGIYQKSHREIKACQTVSKELGDVMSDLLENFCMPEIAGFYEE